MPCHDFLHLNICVALSPTGRPRLVRSSNVFEAIEEVDGADLRILNGQEFMLVRMVQHDVDKTDHGEDEAQTTVMKKCAKIEGEDEAQTPVKKTKGEGEVE